MRDAVDVAVTVRSTWRLGASRPWAVAGALAGLSVSFCLLFGIGQPQVPYFIVDDALYRHEVTITSSLVPAILLGVVSAIVVAAVAWAIARLWVLVVDPGPSFGGAFRPNRLFIGVVVASLTVGAIALLLPMVLGYHDPVCPQPLACANVTEYFKAPYGIDDAINNIDPRGGAVAAGVAFLVITVVVLIAKFMRDNAN